MELSMKARRRLIKHRWKLLAASLLLGAMAALSPPPCGAQGISPPAGAPASTSGLSLGWTEFSAGPLVRVTCATRARVLSDGADAGYTPLLLALAPGRHAIEIVGMDRIDRRTVNVAAGIAGVTELAAALHPYQGMITISLETSGPLGVGAALSIDGLPPEALPQGPFQLDAGRHSISVAAEGFVPYAVNVDVPRDGIAAVRARLEGGYPLRLEPRPPEGATVQLLDAGGKVLRSMDPRQQNMLPPGLARFRLVLSAGRSLEFRWDPASKSAAQAKWTGTLRLGALPADCAIALDGLALPNFGAADSLDVTPGFHVIRISREGYLPAMVWCDISPGEVYTPTAALERDPRIVAKDKSLRVTSFLAAGAAVSLAGLVLAQDSVAIDLSADYQSYKAIKYASMGLVGGGAAFLCLGVTFAL
jgi:hypothetical protein